MLWPQCFQRSNSTDHYGCNYFTYWNIIWLSHVVCIKFQKVDVLTFLPQSSLISCSTMLKISPITRNNITYFVGTDMNRSRSTLNESVTDKIRNIVDQNKQTCASCLHFQLIILIDDYFIFSIHNAHRTALHSWYCMRPVCLKNWHAGLKKEWRHELTCHGVLKQLFIGADNSQEMQRVFQKQWYFGPCS